MTDLKTEGEPLALALARHFAAVTLDRTSATGLATAMAGIVDTVAVTLAGAPEPAVRIVRETLDETCGDGPSLIFGDSRRTGVLNAALINGVAAHAIDYDDMASAMGGHPSVPIVPVIFALGDSLDSSGADLLDAYVVGFETECRLGRAVHPTTTARDGTRPRPSACSAPAWPPRECSGWTSRRPRWSSRSARPWPPA